MRPRAHPRSACPARRSASILAASFSSLHPLSLSDLGRRVGCHLALGDSRMSSASPDGSSKLQTRTLDLPTDVRPSAAQRRVSSTGPSHGLFPPPTLALPPSSPRVRKPLRTLPTDHPDLRASPKNLATVHHPSLPSSGAHPGPRDPRLCAGAHDGLPNWSPLAIFSPSSILSMYVVSKNKRRCRPGV